MHVPDTMTVATQQPEKVLFTWNSMFGNSYFGEGYDILFGNTGTPFALGFRTVIACQMAIASCRQQRTVRWDPETEEIV
jgi:hypothetical protein